MYMYNVCASTAVSSGEDQLFTSGLPASSIKPLQLIQNAAARLIFNEPKRTHVTSLFINLHWLPIRGVTIHRYGSIQCMTIRCIDATCKKYRYL